MVQYVVGDFDAASWRFRPSTRGLLDYGPNFYAPNTMLVPDGLRLVWGWVNGFLGGRGWNGCLSLPRQLSISPDGQLRQAPAPQLSKLRGSEVVWRNVASDQRLALPHTNTLEILAEIDLEKAKRAELQFNCEANRLKPLTISVDDTQLTVADVKVPWPLDKHPRQVSLRIFVDRSVLEVLANETAWVTKTIGLFGTQATLSVHSAPGTAGLKSVRVWPIKTIWQGA